MKRSIRKHHSTLGENFTCWQLPSLRSSLWVLVGLVGTLVPVLPTSALGRTEYRSPTIRVQVDNYTQASQDILARAEREASRILGEAGLTVIWSNCSTGHSLEAPPDPCKEEVPEAANICLRVLSTPPRNTFGDNVFGVAIHPILATVYYDFVLRLAKIDNADFELPIILGTVVAHEIGHLLLDSNSHSAIGIMQPQWGPESIRQAMIGNLVFTHEQAKLIQLEAQKRMRLHVAGLKEMPVGVHER